MGYRSPSAAEGDIQRTRGNPNFGIHLLDLEFWVSSCLGSARDQEQIGIRLGKGRGAQWEETQEALGFY